MNRRFSVPVLGCLVLMSALSSGCMKEFKELAYSTDDAEFAKMLQKEIAEENSSAARVQLGRLAFEHNRLAEAEEVLAPVLQAEPDDMEALAWFGANECKQVGAAFPWLLGIDKYRGAVSCLGKVKTALDKAPDNFSVQLIAINTGSAVNFKDSLVWATRTREILEAAITQNPQNYPAEVVDYFYLAAAENDLAHGKVDSAKTYLSKVVSLNRSPRLVQVANQRLQSI